MNVWTELGRYLKRGLAMILFVLLLIGGGTSALMAVAAGVSALSRASAPQGVPTHTGAWLGGHAGDAGEAGTGGSPPGTSGTAGIDATPGEIGTSGTQSAAAAGQMQSGTTIAAESWSDRINDRIDHMHSPLGAAIDSGGYVIGNRMEQAFGSLLAGVLQTLFLERPNTSAVAGEGSAAAGESMLSAGSGAGASSTAGAGSGGWQ
ncbi:MAG: hypothetical protein IRZ33_04045 [Alicyclobacillaceae bacterium]|nr:hypothetical protein [Alicyclobacillaceae bacterium]